MAETRYTTFDNVSPTQKQLQNEDMKIPSSAFDFGCIHSTTGFIGALIPVDCFDVVPNEHISISMTNFLEFRNPTTRPLLNGFRVYFHGYYNKLTDLWEGAKNFLDTGLSGSISLTRPKLIFKASTQGDDSFTVNASTPLSLMSYLGISPNVYQSSVDTEQFENGKYPPLYWFRAGYDYTYNNHQISTSEINKIDDYYPADCFFAYQKNWRDFYSNRNLLQNNKYWFPDNENHFILSYSCEEAVCVNYDNENLGNNPTVQVFNISGLSNPTSYKIKPTPEPNNPSTVAPDGGWTAKYAPNLAGLKFRQFRGDRFTTALPFPDLIRGDIPLINLNGQTVNAQIIVPNGNTLVPQSDDVNVTSQNKLTISNTLVDSEGTSFDGQIGVKIPVSQITQNALRALETFTVFKERNARISGKDSFYNGFIEAQFGYNPHTHDSRGIYLGGFYQDFALSAVTQTSQSTESSPLGQKSGQGISNGGGTICSNFTTSDFGWIQIYMSIVPEMYYTQGKPRMFSKKTQLDMYFPLFNNLEPQAILNKELFVSGNQSTDNDVFAYEDRYAEYKSRPNRVSGLLALPHSIAEYDASRIMARRFTSTPALNNNFVSMIPENIDMSVFSVMDEPPFDVSCAISVRRVFPGPYTAIPGSLSSQIHA